MQANNISCLFTWKNETFSGIFNHCELSYSMLHFCQIAILLHISILKNVFSPFSHPNSSWTRMPANRWCPSLLLFPPTVRERLILNSLRTLSGFLKDWTDIATLFSISNSQIFDSETQRWGIFERWSLFLFSFSYFRDTQCLKIAQKVAFNIASEASYVYVLSGQKLIKNAKKSLFWRFFENLKLGVK